MTRLRELGDATEVSAENLLGKLQDRVQRESTPALLQKKASYCSADAFRHVLSKVAEHFNVTPLHVCVAVIRHAATEVIPSGGRIPYGQIEALSLAAARFAVGDPARPWDTSAQDNLAQFMTAVNELFSADKAFPGRGAREAALTCIHSFGMAVQRQHPGPSTHQWWPQLRIALKDPDEVNAALTAFAAPAWKQPKLILDNFNLDRSKPAQPDQVSQQTTGASSHGRGTNSTPASSNGNDGRTLDTKHGPAALPATAALDAAQIPVAVPSVAHGALLAQTPTKPSARIDWYDKLLSLQIPLTRDGIDQLVKGVHDKVGAAELRDGFASHVLDLYTQGRMRGEAFGPVMQSVLNTLWAAKEPLETDQVSGFISMLKRHRQDHAEAGLIQFYYFCSHRQDPPSIAKVDEAIRKVLQLSFEQLSGNDSLHTAFEEGRRDFQNSPAAPAPRVSALLLPAMTDEATRTARVFRETGDLRLDPSGGAQRSTSAERSGDYELVSALASKASRFSRATPAYDEHFAKRLNQLRKKHGRRDHVSAMEALADRCAPPAIQHVLGAINHGPNGSPRRIAGEFIGHLLKAYPQTIDFAQLDTLTLGAARMLVELASQEQPNVNAVVRSLLDTASKLPVVMDRVGTDNQRLVVCTTMHAIGVVLRVLFAAKVGLEEVDVVAADRRKVSAPAIFALDALKTALA